MMGLLLGLGMLIDGSIVVTEYADRKISEGMERLEAYRLASKRMFYPILSSIATTIAAFMPLIFWPGFTGQFMRFLPIAVFIVLIASLIYAMIIVPVLGSVLGQRSSALSGGDTDKTGEYLFDSIALSIHEVVDRGTAMLSSTQPCPTFWCFPPIGDCGKS